jgi:N-sulfoglucosamine sulfohydrolase
VKPNFLFITADDLNFDSLGVTGCRVDNISPNLDKLASEGVLFTHSHVTIAVCQPSRSVLMTGKYPHNNGAWGFQEIRHDVPTLQEQLSKANYINGIIGKENHLAPKEKFCWDEYIRTIDEENGLGRDPKAYYKYTRQFLERAKQEGRPFFLMANSHDPHRPFTGSQQELEKFGHPTPASRHYKPDEVHVPGFLPDIADVRKEVAEYYSSAHRLDETVGEILRALKETGLEENTMVMFLSDNGMSFPFAKTNCYLNSTRTPWICRWPGKIKPGTVDTEHFISGIDFMPTILEATGLSASDEMDGTSFLPLLLGEKQQERSEVFTMFNQTSGKKDFPMRCVQNRKFGYIYNAWSDQETVFKNESQSGLSFKAMRAAAQNDEWIASRVQLFEYRVKEEWYDIENDPDALNNRIHDPEHQAEIQSFRNKLMTYMDSTNDPVAHQFRQEIFK